MLIELADVNQFFVFKFKCSLYNDNLFKVFRANKKRSYYTCKKLDNNCVFLCSDQGTCRCSTDEQSITYYSEVIVEKKVRIDFLLLGMRGID